MSNGSHPPKKAASTAKGKANPAGKSGQRSTKSK